MRNLHNQHHKIQITFEPSLIIHWRNIQYQNLLNIPIFAAFKNSSDSQTNKKRGKTLDREHVRKQTGSNPRSNGTVFSVPARSRLIIPRPIPERLTSNATCPPGWTRNADRIVLIDRRHVAAVSGTRPDSTCRSIRLSTSPCNAGTQRERILKDGA